MTERPLDAAAILAVLLVVVVVGAYSPRPAALAVGGMSGGASGSPLETTSSVGLPANIPDGKVQMAPAFVPTANTPPIGPVPPDESMSVLVGLATPDPDAVSGLLSALYTPGTPEYHDFVSPNELAERFGPSDPSISAAVGYFDGFGLDVSVSPDHLLLTVTGPSRELGDAFGTTLDEYRSPAGGWFVSHPSPATLPAVAPWSGVYGLGNRTPLVSDVATEGLSSANVEPLATCAGTGPTDLDACQIWQAYNMSTLVSSGINGSGTRIAVVDAYSSAESQNALTSDISSFAAQNGIAVGTVNFVYPDPTSADLNVSTNPDWNVEDALDLEWARAAAPGATIDMTFSPNPGIGLYEAVDWLVAHQAVNVISMSWGEPDVGVYNSFDQPCSSACNASTDGSYGILSPVLAFAAAEGISIFAASGDCGSADGTSGVATNYPASDPDVTGVGGTNLIVDANGWDGETAWSGNSSGAASPGCQNQGGSGGGYSPFPRPWWQSALPASPAGRGVPDVALDAENPVDIVSNGHTLAVAGTSVATPIWAGIAAIADQSAGAPLGFLNPALYRIAAGANYSADFHDIVSGTNGYSAGPGWDPVTGLGSPRVASLVQNLAARVAVSTGTVASFLYATPRIGKVPLTVTFSVVSTGGTGSYPLEGVSFGDGNASFAPGGAASHTYSVPGVYTAQAYVADSEANYSLSPPLAIVVGGGTSLNVTLTASSESPAVGAAVTFSVGVVGGVSPYEYNFSFGDGTFLDGASSSTATHVFGAPGSFCAAVVVSDAADPPDGGGSGRVAVGVGGAPRPDCRNDTAPLTLTPIAGVGERDAPADFPALFTVGGGSGSTGGLPTSVQYSSTDPYVAACGCAIFRAPGTYNVTAYANDSENEETSAQTSVSVAPPLVANFTASPTFGTAPLTVAFRATASGGYGTNPATTVWSFGNGSQATGASVSATYSAPGMYVAVGHLSDLGDGNASEAFLIDVQPAGSPVPFLTATVGPAVDVAAGTPVNFTAETYAANGTPVPSAFRWTLPDGSGAFRASTNWTLVSPLPGVGGRTLVAQVTAIEETSEATVTADLTLPEFVATEAGGFVPRANALEFSDSGGPLLGPAPLNWSETATVSGPGTSSVDWMLGDGGSASGLEVDHHFAAGRYTVVVTAVDSWGDRAVDVRSVGANESVIPSVSLSPTSGTSPLVVTYRATSTGGVGPPYDYRWAFGNGVNSTGPNGTVLFEANGTYRVTLTVSDLANDTARGVWIVTVGHSSVAASAAFPSTILLAGAAAAGGAIALLAAVSRRGPSRRNTSP